jgi:ribulose-phosphate 3-epimerase
MIENPNEFIPAFADAGANWVSVHYEACTHLHRTLQLIAHHGMKPGVVLNPATRVDLIVDILPMVHHVLIMSVNPGFGGQEFIPFSLKKIRRLAELRRELGLAFKIEVDGGVAHDTVAQVVQAGAELLVAGNAVFGAGHPEQDARCPAGCGPRLRFSHPSHKRKSEARTRFGGQAGCGHNSWLGQVRF